VTTLLERSAADATAANGCAACAPLRDSLSGWGRLDIANALAALTKTPLPPADRLETNDDIGAHTARLKGGRGKLTATLDFWDDQTDVYGVDLRARRRLSLSMAGAAGTTIHLRLWSPQARSVFGASTRKLSVAHAARPGSRQGFSYVPAAGKGGRHYLQVTIAKPGAGRYTLSWKR
jgi:hypothetical protein